MKRLRRIFITSLCIIVVTFSGHTSKAASINDYPSGCMKAPEPQILLPDENMDKSISISPYFVKKSGQSSDRDRLKNANLPDKYDSRERGVVTSVKNQYLSSTCWSFSLLSALESNLISSGQFQNDIDLSEAHLVKYAFTSVEDPLGGTKGDSVRYAKDDIYYRGNDLLVGSRVLANWVGAVPDACMRFPGEETDLRNVSQEEAYCEDIVHLQEIYVVDYLDKDDVKSTIMKYGAVSTSCVMYAELVNNDNGAYYFPDSGYTPNHGIVIVGWDDNYSRENFLNDPGMDGAWLVKNSYGEEFGDKGYNWISYNDQGIERSCFVLGGEKADNYDQNYQYDGSYMDCYYGAYSGVKASNVFKVDENSSKKQILKAVSFSLATATTDYEIQVYKNPSDVTNPESGTAMLSNPVTGFVEYAGYYTIKLPEEVTLSPGDTFAVVITFYDDEVIAIFAEASVEWEGIEFTASAEPNTSMVKPVTSECWEDFGQKYNINFRIKAFTCYSDEEESQDKRIPFKDVVETDWEYPYVCDVYEKNIMVGLSNEEFGKNRNLTRAEFVTVLYSMSGRPQLDYEAVFTDVPEGKWYSIPVVWAKKNGVTAGYGDQFGVADKITREQIVRMMYSFSGDAEKETKPDVERLDKFADADKISSWAKEAVAWSIENNVIAGKPLEPGKLFMDPQGYATRGECATIISKYLAARE